MDLGAFLADVYSYYLDKYENKNREKNKILKNFYTDYGQFAEKCSLEACYHILENIEGDFNKDEKTL